MSAIVFLAALSSASAHGTVIGTVDAGPTCPVERADHPCPPRPLSVTVQARDPHGRLAGSTRSDAHGRFRLKLSPGVFGLRVLIRAFPRCPIVAVRIRAGKTARVAVHCDTGIR